MNKEIAEKWVAALRSGKYKQGRGALNKNDSFCCLGVLCDISETSNWRRFVDGVCAYSVEGGRLPKSVSDWANISLHPTVGNTSLSILNDKGLSFLEIADVIEENWEVL